MGISSSGGMFQDFDNLNHAVLRDILPKEKREGEGGE